jgi:transposase
VRRYSGNHETSDLRPFTFGHRRRVVANRALRSKDAFVMRRAHIILASERGERASRIARSLGCGSRTVRDAIHTFNERGLGALKAGSSRPKRTRSAFDEESAERLRQMLHRSPREFGHDSSLWTLEMAAEVAFRGGTHTKAGLRGDHPGDSGASARSSLAASETMDHLPRSPIRKKKRRRDRLMRVAETNPDWAVGFCDECWWSRLALPTLSSWSEEGEPLRLVQKSVAKDDPEPKAVSCYGL